MAQDKKIEDYLHLYLGCEVKCPKLSGWIYSQKRVTLSRHFWLENWEKELIPILRPLSDMSEEEQANEPLSCFEGTRYLLSKHFDLFGLIETGIAIDKNSLK